MCLKRECCCRAGRSSADYRDINGVQIPFKRTEKDSTPKLGAWTYQVEKIETGLKLDTDPFVID